MQQRHIFTNIIISLAHKTRFNQTMNAVHKKSLPREALKLDLSRLFSYGSTLKTWEDGWPLHPVANKESMREILRQ